MDPANKHLGDVLLGMVTIAHCVLLVISNRGVCIPVHVCKRVCDVLMLYLFVCTQEST